MMGTPAMDFVVGCCAEANWVGYGRGLELIYEFLDNQAHMACSNQELIDFLNFRSEGVDIGYYPERLGTEDLVSCYARDGMWSDEDILTTLCEYIDEENLLPCLMGFMNDMVDYHGSNW
mgnify:CR=1 FL=1